MEGILFDIEPFALHDGPGIRTTIFLKGCPLRCQWCSNPESFLKRSNLSYNREKCNACFSCVKVCETGALSKLSGVLEVQHDLCNACGKCIDECPEDALKIYGYRESARNIVKEVLKDKAYFDNSGGGMTLSGGEPLMQADFTMEILKEAKKAGLHTCIETCGFAAEKEYEKILPLVDMFLFDYKAGGGENHMLLTKQSNKLILENLKFLNASKATIVLRCPIVPGVNDTTAHFKDIARLSHDLDQIREVELMPYHNYGERKYEQIGLPEPGLGIPAATEEQEDQWYADLAKLNCEKLKNRYE